jgi:hypothetical protein
MKYAPFMIPLAFFRAGEGNFYKAGIESPVALASARLPGYRVKSWLRQRWKRASRIGSGICNDLVAIVNEWEAKA